MQKEYQFTWKIRKFKTYQGKANKEFGHVVINL